MKREKGQVVLGPLKTPTGKRRLRVPDYVIAALRVLHHAPNRAEWIFISKTGTPIDPSNAYYWLQRVSQAAGIDKIRPHDARRSALMMLARGGAGPAQIQAFAGHVDPKVALSICARLDVSGLDGCADTLDRFQSDSATPGLHDDRVIGRTSELNVPAVTAVASSPESLLRRGE
jgi:hypothetical protein